MLTQKAEHDAICDKCEELEAEKAVLFHALENERINTQFYYNLYIQEKAKSANASNANGNGQPVDGWKTSSW